MKTFAIALLFCLLSILPLATQAAVPAAPMPAARDDLAARHALVNQYVTEQRFGPLYQKVLAQYTGFIPTGKQDQAEAMVANPVFRDRIFTIVRDQLASTFTLEELQAKADFLQTPAGQGIVAKVNEKGMSFRNSDLTPDEHQALRDFDATPIGQSIVQKGSAFTSRLLSQIFKTFLIYQSSLQ